MHYLCLIYVLKSSNYLSNVPSYVKTWKLRAVIHDTSSKHISGQEVTGDHHSLSQKNPKKTQRLCSRIRDIFQHAAVKGYKKNINKLIFFSRKVAVLFWFETCIVLVFTVFQQMFV